MIAQIAPAAVALAQLGLLDQAGHRHHQGAREQLMRVACDAQHMLHLRDYLIGLAVLVLVMDAAAKGLHERNINPYEDQVLTTRRCERRAVP